MNAPLPPPDDSARMRPAPPAQFLLDTTTTPQNLGSVVEVWQCVVLLRAIENGCYLYEAQQHVPAAYYEYCHDPLFDYVLLHQTGGIVEILVAEEPSPYNLAACSLMMENLHRARLHTMVIEFSPELLYAVVRPSPEFLHHYQPRGGWQE